jgi:hypothetical protein
MLLEKNSKRRRELIFSSVKILKSQAQFLKQKNLKNIFNNIKQWYSIRKVSLISIKSSAVKKYINLYIKD